LRDDFEIAAIHPIKVALTAEQVARHKLPPMLKAKTSSSQYAKFAAAHGDDVFELEALPPAALQGILREAIDGVIDREAFNAELTTEKRDAAFLAGIRQRVATTLGRLRLDDEA
jgi:hypothetical protein